MDSKKNIVNLPAQVVTKLFNCANCKGEKTVKMVIQRRRVSTNLELFECTNCDHQWDYTDFYGQNADPKAIYYRELKKINKNLSKN